MVICTLRGAICLTGLLFFADEKTPSQSHQAADECLYGLVAARKKENCGAQSGQAQCRNIERARTEVEAARRGGQTTLY